MPWPSVLCGFLWPFPVEETGKERCTRGNPARIFAKAQAQQKQARLAAGAPACRVSPKKGLEGKVYEEDSNSAAFDLFCFALSSMALCYRNILTKMRRLRSDFVKNCEGFMKCGVWSVECGVWSGWKSSKRKQPRKPKLFVFAKIPKNSCFPLRKKAGENSPGFSALFFEGSWKLFRSLFSL